VRDLGRANCGSVTAHDSVPTPNYARWIIIYDSQRDGESPISFWTGADHRSPNDNCRPFADANAKMIPLLDEVSASGRLVDDRSDVVEIKIGQVNHSCGSRHLQPTPR
jgi:hypothetical protein